MHSHHIALALADARVADLQAAATHSTATLPPRRHRRHRRALTLIGLAATAVLAASAPTGALAQPLHDASTPASTRVYGAATPKPAQDLRALAKTSSLAGPAVARPDASIGRADALRRAAVMRSLAHHQRRLDSRLSPPASPVGPASAPIVRITRVADGGFDWVDASIGAGLAAALLLSAAGVSARRRQHAPATR